MVVRAPSPPSPQTDASGPATLPLAERRARGRKLRMIVARRTHGEWAAPGTRDPIGILIENGKYRLQELLPVRYGRMLQSPFTFLRGAAAVMAADLATTPSSGIRVQACGDCHLMNFGFYTSPEGRAVFDINDFDETLPAPFEWDIKRLATSIVLAGRSAGLSERLSTKAVRAAVRAYRDRMIALAKLDPIAAWNWRVDVQELIASLGDDNLRAREESRLKAAAATLPPYQDFPKMVRRKEGGWRIHDNPPLIFHFDQALHAALALQTQEVFARYRETLPWERRVLFDRYRLVDTAFKVVGIGSVGTFCAVGLFMTADESPLFLQIKEAQTSVLAPHAGPSAYVHQGERVVVGQRIMQAVSDPFLGWAHDDSQPAPRARGRHVPKKRYFYVRQLKDRKLASMGEMMEREALRFYAHLCGTTLARAHARSGDAATIAGYLGSGEAFDDAIETFAVDYADQSERDHLLLVEAVRAGRLEARTDTPS